MVEKKTIAYSSLISLIVMMTVLGGQSILENNILDYYCEERGIVMECDRLSDTYKTCYNAQYGNKRCLSTWAEITKDTELPDINTTKQSDLEYSKDPVNIEFNGNWYCPSQEPHSICVREEGNNRWEMPYYELRSKI